MDKRPKFKHTLVPNWRISTQHWCGQHQRIEYGDAYATSGMVSILTLVNPEDADMSTGDTRTGKQAV